MAVREPSELVSFDGDAAVDALREHAEGTLYSVVEYDTAAYRPLLVDDATITLYGGEEAMHAHFERIHSHVNLDFTEIELFVEDLFPVADRVEAITTRLDYLTVVRIYGDREGLFVAVEPGEPTAPLVDAVRDLIEE